MRIIRFSKLEKKNRPDGRTVTKIVEQELRQNVESMQILYVTHPPRLEEDLHVHEKSYEMLLFLDDARYRINGEDYEIYKNDFVIFEPGDVHGAIPVNQEVRLWVFQNPAIIDDKKIVKKI